MRSVKNVVDEIEMLYKTYGIKKIFIADDTFTASCKNYYKDFVIASADMPDADTTDAYV